MNDELAALMQQKREIESKIRELKAKEIRYGNAKIGVEHYPTDKPDRHFLSVLYYPIDGRCRWMSIFSAGDQKTVIDAIPGIVADLNGLYEAAKGA